MEASAQYSVQDWLLLFAYVAAGLVGVTGNGFIISTIYKRGMKTTTFALIANQAFSDMSCGLFYLSMWFFCSSKMLSFGMPGHIVCEMALTLKTSTFVVSILTMSAISIERYLKLYKPHNCFLKPFRTVIFIWVISVLSSVCAMFHFRASEFFTDNKLIGCRVAYETEIAFFQSHYNYVITLGVGCFVPVAVTSFMYYKVIAKIREANIGEAVTPAAPRIGTDQAYSDEQVEAFEESKRKTTKMLILIVLTYFAACSPLFLMWFIHFFVAHILPEPCTNSVEEPLYYRLAYLSCVTSICLNPFIYCHYNQIFKSEAKSILRSIWSCGRRSDKGHGKELSYVSSYKNSNSSAATDRTTSTKSSSSSYSNS